MKKKLILACAALLVLAVGLKADQSPNEKEKQKAIAAATKQAKALAKKERAAKIAAKAAAKKHPKVYKDDGK